MSRTLGSCGTAVLIALQFSPALAQTSEQPVQRKPDIVRICAISIERLCPALASPAGLVGTLVADPPPQPRNAAICLKPYRTSLSLPCRAAVNAFAH